MVHIELDDVSSIHNAMDDNGRGPGQRPNVFRVSERFGGKMRISWPPHDAVLQFVEILQAIERLV